MKIYFQIILVSVLLLNSGASLKTNHKQDLPLQTGWYYISETNNGFKRQLDKSQEIYFINPIRIVSVKNFTKLEVYESSAGIEKYVGLAIYLDKKGRKAWSIATEESVGKQLAFILDNKLLYAPKVISQITGGLTAINRKEYSREELEVIKKAIETEK